MKVISGLIMFFIALMLTYACEFSGGDAKTAFACAALAAFAIGIGLIAAQKDGRR